MNRKEAKALIKNDVDAYGKPRKIMTKIDQIYDDFDKLLEEVAYEAFMSRPMEFTKWFNNIKKTKNL